MKKLSISLANFKMVDQNNSRGKTEEKFRGKPSVSFWNDRFFLCVCFLFHIPIILISTAILPILIPE